MWNDSAVKPAACAAVDDNSYAKPSPTFSSACNWSPAAAACRALSSSSSYWARPRVAGGRSAHAAGGLKASAEEEQPSSRRRSLPRTVTLHGKEGEAARHGSSGTAAAPPAPGGTHRRAVHRHLEAFWLWRSVRAVSATVMSVGFN